MSRRRVIVIGGGPSGMMAAGQAASSGEDVILLEKMGRPGRKLAITGKGRCNLTNIAPLPDFIEHLKPNGHFLYQAFSRFFTDDLISFFNSEGLPTQIERGGRVFPKSGKAQDVVDILTRWIENLGVFVSTKSSVDRLVVKNRRITGVAISEDSSYITSSLKTHLKKHNILESDAVVISCGGASYPATGSTGDGYRLAKSIGHNIVPIRPALVPLETAGDLIARLEGLNLRNVAVRLIINGKLQAEAFGEISFTNVCVSGPTILSLSKLAVDALHLNHMVTISIDLKPALDDIKLDRRILRDLDKYGKRQFKTILQGLLPKTLIPICIQLTNISPDKRGNQITSQERSNLRSWLKNFSIEVTKHRPFSEAIITAGGVDTVEIDPRSMASRLIDGLFFAGEVLDIDADTGGYNLQAAFSTGWIAGKAAANFVRSQ